MIAGLRGVVHARTSDAVLMDVGGVIYRVGTSSRSLGELGDAGDVVELLTHLVVREDQLTLYGFTSQAELTMFEALIGVSGIGPRLALALLSHLAADTLPLAIEQGNADLLATVPGVGKKTAARLIVELRGKLPEPSGGTVRPAGQPNEDALAALRSLGYTTAEAHHALARAGITPDMSVEEQVVSALRELAG